MFRNDNYRIYTDRIELIDLLAMAYLGVVFVMSFFSAGSSYLIFAVLVLMALPFYRHIEIYTAIALLLSTIAYFFAFSDETLFSIYTILVLLIAIRSLKSFTIKKTMSYIPRIILVIIAFVSYNLSPFDCKNGLIELIYIIFISLLITGVCNFSMEKFVIALVKMSCAMLVLLLINFALNPVFTASGKMTIANGVNANSTAFAVLFPTVIISGAYFFGEFKKKIILMLMCIGFVAMIVTGSRNGLLAFVFAITIVALIHGKNKGKIANRIVGIVLVGILFITLVDVFFGDTLFARYSISYIVETGGTNRVNVWTSVIPYVYRNYFTFGYGPSKGATTQVLLNLVGRTYSHTHNTFVEVFSQIGITGLIAFIWIVKACISNILNISKINAKYYLIAIIFFGIIFAGIGESYFNNMTLWLIIALSLREPEDDECVIE